MARLERQQFRGERDDMVVPWRYLLPFDTVKEIAADFFKRWNEFKGSVGACRKWNTCLISVFGWRLYAGRALLV